MLVMVIGFPELLVMVKCREGWTSSCTRLVEFWVLLPEVTCFRVLGLRFRDLGGRV